MTSIANSTTEIISKDSSDDTECALCFKFKPKWAQFLASRRIFALVLGFLTIIQGMEFFYVVTVMTSMESHFQLPSKTFGIVFSVGEVLVTIIGFIIALFVGSNSHRPRLIAISVAFMGIGCFLFTLPYYLYGPPKVHNITHSGSKSDVDFLCVKNSLNLTNSPNLTNSSDNDEYNCQSPLQVPDGSSTDGITALLLIAYTLANIGSIAVFIIGTPFLDDNVESKNSPIYIAITCSVRSLGPVIGSFMGSLCLAIYIDPQNPSWFDANDGRWVGAWWIGFLIIGCLSFICSFAIAQFPKRLPSKNLTPAIKMNSMNSVNNISNVEVEENPNKTLNIPSIREIMENLKRPLVNVLLWCRMFSEMFTWFSREGFVIYLPKYLEKEFQMTSSQAGLWSGLAKIMPPVFGFLIVGYLVKRFKFEVRQLSFAVVITKLIESATLIALIFIKCEESHLLGSGNSESVCGSADCDCSLSIMSPVCGSDGHSYFSACHAGCTTSMTLNNTTDVNVFNNCTCVGGVEIAESRLCNINCSSKIIYLVLVTVSSLGMSVDFVAGILFMLRCVEPRDKTLTSGFMFGVLGILTFIPCPLVFSAAIDWSCLVWSKQCGRDEKGACDVYDMNKMSSVLHIVPVTLLLIGVFWDTMFWHFCKGKMTLFDDMTKNT